MRRGILMAGLWVLCGCGDDVDHLERVFDKTAAKFDGATESMRGKLQNGEKAVRGVIAETSLDTRVVLRMRWDADLVGAEVQAQQIGPGTVELTGTVNDLAQQRRAVELAQTTVGVEKVLDRLTLASDAEKP